MSNYYIGKCDFSKKEWSDVDRPSRYNFIQLLNSISYFSNIGESQGACSWDVSCMMTFEDTTKKIVFELKDRNMDSDKFGDIMVEYDKYTNNLKYCPNFVIVAVNSFKDGVIAMCPMNETTIKKSEKWCPATTLLRGTNRKYVKKEVATLKQAIKFKKIKNKWRKI